MSTTSRKFIVAYIICVGLPLAGLAGVLKAGGHLSAPISIDGTWKLEADSASVANRACADAVSSLLDSPLTISQSGVKMMASSAKANTVSLGTIDGTKIRAALVPSADSRCGSDQTLILVADVNPKATPATLNGRLTTSDCASCAPIDFHGTKQPKPQAEGAH